MPCTIRTGMLILGTILSLRASGSNVFCRPKNRQSVLPKRFALRMSWDFDCFLFKSYVPLESGRNVFAQPPMPRTAMEQSGHAQVPTLLVALVRRQARRAGWRAEIAYKNTEEWKFQKEKRYQFEGFAFQNILKARLYFFLRQYALFMNTREQKNSNTL